MHRCKLLQMNGIRTSGESLQGGVRTGSGGGAGRISGLLSSECVLTPPQCQLLVVVESNFRQE